MIIQPDILIMILIGLVLIVGLGLVRLEIKLKKLCRGAQGADLESSINALADKLETLNKFEDE